ncbi:winged helix-turn-helix domain-containing protein [Ruegeria sp. 2205SS24-7]|uniref:winged helix-turn-helix domain-containing protein n=1 Tax=Ruegeria discodermiae TaxID=3064389 RepID=UPI0027422D13|nr:winged helix-turn-helix domain-containing protein [Ruegeria sp. 2205SS24-7]MDP5218766.1 winged helix-turn-helix domain-containing protein [Ruegeria sp. 2205SS24-7]
MTLSFGVFMKLSIDGWLIDLAARTALRDNHSEQLSPRAIRLLQVLVDADGKVVERSKLLDRVWPHVIVSDESLTQVVSELRRVLKNRNLIATVARGGYRLNVPFEQTSDHKGMSHQRRDGPILSLDAYTLSLEAQECFARGGEGDFRSYFDLSAQAAAMAPGNAEIRALHAEALLKRHIYWSEGAMLLDRTLEEAGAAIRLDPTSARGYLADASARIAIGWVEPGLSSLETALAFGREDADVHLDAAKLAYTMGNSRAAAALAIRAATLAPDQFEPDFLAARIFVRTDAYRSRLHAERALRKVQSELSLNPHSMRALYTLGPLLAILGDHRAALSGIESVTHHDSPLEYNRALAFAEIGDVSSAIERLRFLGLRGWRHACILGQETSFRRVTAAPAFRDLDKELMAV